MYLLLLIPHPQYFCIVRVKEAKKRNYIWMIYNILYNKDIFFLINYLVKQEKAVSLQTKGKRLYSRLIVETTKL